MIYRDFARLYTMGEYPNFSIRMAEILPTLLDQFKIEPTSILDLACGEGSFAVAMAKKGFKVTGVDQSQEMLSFARRKALAEHVKVHFLQMDIRNLKLTSSFDLVTCWFDSLNYLLTIRDLEQTFASVTRYLNSGGFFIFDMNTIFWLATLAQRYPTLIEKDTSDIFQVHHHSFDENTHIATFQITGFLKDNDRWTRQVDETHLERGYKLNEIRLCLENAGLTELAALGNLEGRLPIAADSKRIWFVTQKQTTTHP